LTRGRFRVESRDWYQVFGSGQNVDTETRPGDQSKPAYILLSKSLLPGLGQESCRDKDNSTTLRKAPLGKHLRSIVTEVI